MSTHPWKGYRCWDTPTVQRTVFSDIGALNLEADAVFLAAHTSLDIRHEHGMPVAGAERELAVLRALDSTIGQGGQNTVIAVTGDTGSGKSHLVRWVRSHLKENDKAYRLVYVPRELANLRDLIGRILDGLGDLPEAQDLRSDLDNAIAGRGPDQMAESLLDALRSVLAYQTPYRDDPRRLRLLGEVDKDGGTRKRGGLADLMLRGPIRDHLLRKDGVIDQVIASLRGVRTGGDERTPEFGEADIRPQIAGIEAALVDSPDLLKLWRDLPRLAPVAVKLMNEVLAEAVASTLQIRPGSNLFEVFSSARRRLRKEGLDLVLLFEDLALFSLVDAAIYDQFVLQPGDEYAPLRVAFAVTTGKFNESVPDTVRSRLTHRFIVGGLGSGEDGTEAPAIPFVARYLNVARVGRERLLKAWESAGDEAREAGSWIPNACVDLCPHLASCREGFEEVEKIGLYPYNETALQRALKRQGPDPTPRELVSTLVHDFLIAADQPIREGSFPDEPTRTLFDFSTTKPRDGVVPPTADLDEATGDRVFRCRVIWGNEEKEKEKVREAFDLPDVPFESDPSTTGTKTHTVTITQTVPQQFNPLLPLYAWENGERLPEREAVYYREHLRDLVLARVDFASMLFSPSSDSGKGLRDYVFAPNSFELENAPGAGPGKHRLSFPVKDDSAGVQLLAAVRWICDHLHWDFGREHNQWVFPSAWNPIEVRLRFDEFIDDCARQVEAAITERLDRGAFTPQAMAVGLRVVAARGLGVPALETGAHAVEHALAAKSAPLRKPSPAWTPVSSRCLKVLENVDPSWVAAFATARQGDTAPLAVDAAGLMPALIQALTDPIGLLDAGGSLDDLFADMDLRRAELKEALLAVTKGEAAEIYDLLNRLQSGLADDDISEIVGLADSAGTAANDEGAFRPMAKFSAFRDACSRLRILQPSDPARWLRALPRLGPAEPGLVGAVLDAQEWAPVLRTTVNDIQLVRDCLMLSLDEVQIRIGKRISDMPHDLVEAMLPGLDELGELLGELAGGDGA